VTSVAGNRNWLHPPDALQRGHIAYLVKVSSSYLCPCLYCFPASLVLSWFTFRVGKCPENTSLLGTLVRLYRQLFIKCLAKFGRTGEAGL
jgi:hypothetical protein